ncbi:hypothetical protein [Lysobacter sp. N42]|uniref:hypothetical protein n=1 Tax=Lysobacter sp. N42 TaxID=2545719 RepID=UPI001047C53F|nr:hypothetical protein [Lysobacter sp. N42]TCZ79721.1 hypothetical protein EYQ95_25135 [Lysobacter sp. N42]
MRARCAGRWALVFGSLLYAFFTFGWPPLAARGLLAPPPHYIHLMFVTLLLTVAFALAASRLMAVPRAAADAA